MGVWTLENEYCSDGFSALKYKFEEGQYDPLMIKGLGAVIFRCNSHPTSPTGYDCMALVEPISRLVFQKRRSVFSSVRKLRSL